MIGCALAVTFINTLPAPVLLLLIVLAVGTSHAYGLVAYRITAIGASISSLLLLHFVDPLVHAAILRTHRRHADRRGPVAGLSAIFLPNWERDDLPRTVRGLLAADAAFARRGPARPVDGRKRYRLARKKALDAVAQLSGAIRRLADEPNTNRRALASLGELLGAHYLLASDLTSMPVLVKLRAADLDAPAADAAIAATRERVVALLDQTARLNSTTRRRRARQPFRPARQRGDGSAGRGGWITSNMPPAKWRGWRRGR